MKQVKFDFDALNLLLCTVQKNVTNHIATGLLSGIVVPLLGVLLYYTIRFMPDNVSLNSFLFLLKSNHHMIPKVLSLGMIAYIPLITYFKNRRCQRSLQGVFVTIIIYASIVVLYKLDLI